jgi:hypothetical protein
MLFLTEHERDFSRSRILTYGDAQFTWMQGQGSTSGRVRICSR